MRVVAQVFLAYGLMLALGALWRMIPFELASPDIAALIAVYLGLTARPTSLGPLDLRVAPVTLGAVVLGYLGDLLMGTPRGFGALTAGIVCLVGHGIHSTLIVRGRLLTVVFSMVTGLLSAVVMLILRASAGLFSEGVMPELWMIVATALVTGLAGPVVFRLCRLVDAQFARTHRERDATLGGISL